VIRSSKSKADPGQALYEFALESLLATIAGAKKRDRPVEHELLVQETLLRATGDIKA
jgi:hypothetical protein